MIRPAECRFTCIDGALTYHLPLGVGLIPPVRLRIKDTNGVVRDQGTNKDELYWDGSIEQDIPTSGLAEMLNCQFIVAAQCNPHIVPFFYNSKGEVGRPSRWSSGGVREHSWRGGFLLSALELYLKTDVRAKFKFLDEVEAAIGFTSTMTNQTYGGSTTIVPQVSFLDYFRVRQVSFCFAFFRPSVFSPLTFCFVPAFLQPD